MGVCNNCGNNEITYTCEQCGHEFCDDCFVGNTCITCNETMTDNGDM